MTRTMCILATLLLTTLPSAAALRIDVNYDQLVTEIQPESTQLAGRGGTSFVLQNDGQVTRVSAGGGTSTNSLSGYVSTVNRGGIGGVSHYKVSHNTIVEYYENQYVRDTITITTDGANLCRASAITRPARGQRYIIWLNPTRYMSRIQDINVTCRMQRLN